MYKVLRLIHEYQLVTVWGFAGNGKSSLAIMLAHFMFEREMFANGIIFISAGYEMKMINFINKLYLEITKGVHSESPQHKREYIIESLKEQNLAMIMLKD